jgi:hypothetical protein
MSLLCAAAQLWWGCNVQLKQFIQADIVMVASEGPDTHKGWS